MVPAGTRLQIPAWVQQRQAGGVDPAEMQRFRQWQAAQQQQQSGAHLKQTGNAANPVGVAPSGTPAPAQDARVAGPSTGTRRD
jgi:ferric-dicitrate binding protein FerR (iron transport regulator)